MAAYDLMLEGKYKYYQDDKVYSEEHFKLKKEDKVNGNFIIEAETSTRVRTGEFLKTIVNYGFTPQYNTLKISVRRLLGGKESLEIVKADHKEKSLLYTFSADGQKSEQELNFNNYVHLGAPCFVTSMLMTQMKKIDPVHRTQYSVLTSNNIWDFSHDVFFQDVFVNLEELEPVNLKVGGNELRATHCKIFQVDENGTLLGEGNDIFLSKFHGIPYKGVFGDNLFIEIDSLKQYESAYTKMF